MPSSANGLPTLHPAQRRTLRPRLRLSIRDASLTDLSHPDDSSGRAANQFWKLEPSPLVLSAEEWAPLEAGLRQRARLINALLVDIYHGQQVLREKILPPEAVLSDPFYRRPCLGLEPERANPATLLRFDLVRTPAGWRCVQTRSNTPIGLSYAVQNRRFMTQEAGDLYRSLPDYHSVINFPLQLLGALRALAPRDRLSPSIVVLTAGPRDAFYSEHSFLARKMGLPLARGDDLLVLDNTVYFKTVGGLERVDVIYRRLNDAHIDPVVFSTDRETAGIPGLLQCIRAGRVALANSIGTGLAESRVIEAYLPRLAKFYLGEKLLLPSPECYACGDPDRLEQILDQSSRFVIRPAHVSPDNYTVDRSVFRRPLLTAKGLARV
ncbi:MAG: circularly permuted type 2 ATP-grasp protein, partial [Burkholderiales bacterium]|nr:circularly permuted type 2 ATP-grasp protein [Opitutaceae bacterium]